MLRSSNVKEGEIRTPCSREREPSQSQRPVVSAVRQSIRMLSCLEALLSARSRLSVGSVDLSPSSHIRIYSPGIIRKLFLGTVSHRECNGVFYNGDVAATEGRRGGSAHKLLTSRDRPACHRYCHVLRRACSWSCDSYSHVNCLLFAST